MWYWLSCLLFMLIVAIMMALVSHGQYILAGAFFMGCLHSSLRYYNGR